jgi:hypothetical protein
MKLPEVAFGDESINIWNEPWLARACCKPSKTGTTMN